MVLVRLLVSVSPVVSRPGHTILTAHIQLTQTTPQVPVVLIAGDGSGSLHWQWNLNSQYHR